MDITRCKGDKCPVKDRCYRYISDLKDEEKIDESYFATPPFTIEDKTFKCEMFWGENNDYIINQIENILNGK